MGESKKRINSMYSYGVCSSYTEYRRFKKSAAKMVGSPHTHLPSQAPSEGEQDDNPRIRRVPNDSSEVPYDVDIHRYQGPKQPCYKAIPTLKSLAHQAIAVRRASEVNHSFLQDILAKEDCPEFHGYHETMQGAGSSSTTEDENHLLAPD